ncbi:MAG: CCA tRNA nucleotidyltransferase [Pseudomonadota bacterium]
MSARGPFAPLPESLAGAFDWRNTPHLKDILSALNAVRDDTARFVGGCVRDSLLGAAPKDYDIATSLTPEAVIKALYDAGLRSAPTGLDHGTVTAIAEKGVAEITTLRKDITTDGRRATVSFTDNWEADARRRDFRINAIYLTADGKLFDPVGGLNDIYDKRVQFIGDPYTRIREDYLRILRFFRFTARFAEAIDPSGEAACSALATQIATLSGERIGAEMKAILTLPRGGEAVTAMDRSGVLAAIDVGSYEIPAFIRLKSDYPDAGAMVGLAVLFGESPSIDRRFRLSNAEKSERRAIIKTARQLKDIVDDRSVRRLIYQAGEEIVLQSTQYAVALQQVEAGRANEWREIVANWSCPEFPISGKDLIARGMSPGPDIGRKLAAIEAQWIEDDFPGPGRLDSIIANILAQGG